MSIFFQRLSWRVAVPLLLVLGGVMCWLFSRRSFDVLHAVPEQSALVLLFSGTEQLTAISSGRGRVLADLSVLRVLRADLDQVMALLPDGTENAGRLRLAASFSLNPNDSLHPLLVLDLGSPDLAARLVESISEKAKISSSVFRSNEIFTVETPGKARFALASNRNLVFLSQFSYLVENALAQAGKRDSWWLEQANRSDASFRIVLRSGTLAERLKGYMAPEWEYLPGRLAEAYSSIVLGFDGKKWQVSLQAHPSRREISGGQLPYAHIAAIVPDNTAFMSWSAAREFGSIGKHFSNDANSLDFSRSITPWAGKEAAWVLTEPYSPGMRDERFWVCSIRDAHVAQRSLDEYGERTGLLQRYVYQTFEIRQFLSRSLLAPLLHGTTTGFQNPACVLLDGYAVFGASPAALERWIDKYVVSQTLTNQPDYLLLASQMQAVSDQFVLFNAAYTSLLARHLLHPAKALALQDDMVLLQNTGLFGLELREDGAGAFVNQSSSTSASAAGILWKIPLDGQAITQPFLVPATQPGQESTVLIQDEQFQLYCLTVNGELLWRKKLDRPIQSAVHGIDFFGNGGVCYLFNTASDLWILDPEGREAAGYPLHLQSLATNGVTAVNFNNEQKYGLFIACANGNLYGFDPYGRPLPGWNPQSGTGPVRHPLIHVKSETKDYLAVISLNGQLSVFNRVGVPHLAPLKLDGDFSSSSLQFEASADSRRIVSMNTSGKIWVCNLGGQTIQHDLNSGQDKHFLVFEALSGGGQKGFAVLSGKSLMLYKYENNSPFKYATRTFLDSQDTLFATGWPGRLGTVNRSKRQIYLTAGNGEIPLGFPLAGTTPFVLYQPASDRKTHVVIVGNGASICAYRVLK
ncbi:MAG: DUF3352 domain-containing protein [Saprospiraceae bacterium]|nr:DUF3352 domain-containing protein [Saprospiraceae bacterium]